MGKLINHMGTCRVICRVSVCWRAPSGKSLSMASDSWSTCASMKAASASYTPTIARALIIVVLVIVLWEEGAAAGTPPSASRSARSSAKWLQFRKKKQYSSCRVQGRDFVPLWSH